MTDHLVVLAPEAIGDIVALHRYIAGATSPERADAVRDRLIATCQSLESLPGRGHRPPELDRIGVTSFREIHWKPYRVIYTVDQETVRVHAVLDGRRDLQDLLSERLLR
jgi:toxin ParE1/3/4